MIPMKSIELYQTNEFKALCNLLGIEWEKATLGLTIEIGPDPDNCVKVTHSYYAQKTEPTVIETTNQHNKEFRTYR